MKPFAINLILLCFVVGLYGQTNNEAAAKIPGPKFLNHIYYYGKDTLTDLEQASAHMISRTKAFGYGGSEAGYSMDGEKSAVRFGSGDSIRFVVKTNGAMGDPSMMIRLYKFITRKGNREVILSSQAGPYQKRKGHESDDISFNIQQSGNDVYLIIPASALTSGEYGFLNMMMIHGNGMKMTYTVFAFGIN